ncbi:PKD domain-containing protein [Rurimicrobium arvi]|uniref:PKD domain-containing protein n=1 Tax=Rurimicrobium arvi TaxID=2049916 RepID=A0ABP8MDX3_9BACT
MSKQTFWAACILLLAAFLSAGHSYAGCKLPGGWTQIDSCPVFQFEGNKPLDSSGKPYTDSCLKYTWNFGDSATASGRIVTHTYTKNGTYYVCLKIQDLCRGCDTTICKTVTVSCYYPTKCKMPRGWSQIDSCPFYHFEGNNPLDSSGKPYTNPCLKYTWNFGDGYTASGRIASHTYSTGGTYNVCMTVLDTCKGCDTIICKKVYVSCISSGCTLPVGWSSSDSCGHFSFEGKNPVDSSGKPYTDSCLQYTWTFGDGTSGTGRLITHTYTATGTYIVCLKVKNLCFGCDTTICKKVSVTCVSAPKACNLPDGWSSKSDSCSNWTFEGHRPLDASGKPYTDSCLVYLWSFGDSSVATGRVVSHHYATVGKYTVCLRIIDTCRGCDTMICNSVGIPCYSPALTTDIQSVSGEASTLSVFPNPANGNFTIRSAGRQQYRVFDAFGRMVMSGQFTDRISLSASELSTGVYSVQCISNDQVQQTRLVITR